MSDNARFHNKLHRKNHHTSPTDGYPDSATDPIASESEPFTGDFFLDGNLNVSGSINTVYNTLSNISIPVPVLSAQIGFQPSNSLVVQLSGVKYAIPVTLVGNSTFNNETSGVNSLANYVTYLGNVSSSGSLSGQDSDNWNLIYSTVIANSGDWDGGNTAYTVVNTNSGIWDGTYTNVNANSGNWDSNVSVSNYVISNSATFDNSYTSTVYAKLSSLAYTFNYNNNSIQANSLNNCSNGQLAGVLAGLNNNAFGYASVVAGGGTNTASGNYSIIGGGGGNSASGNSSGIIGGLNNSVSGCNSFAIGSNIVTTTPNYTFVNNISSTGAVNALSGFMKIISVGREGIGTQLSNTVGQFFSNECTFSQINHQNVCNGTGASTDYIATADNGNDSCYYVDLGINSSFYSNSAYDVTGPNDAYLFAQGCNLAIGTANDTGDVIIHTGGTRTQNERMRITSLGNVGIGTNVPVAALTVVGDISASGDVYFSNAVYVKGASIGSITTVAGCNTVSNTYSTIGGGFDNTSTGIGSIIGGGYSNTVSNDYGSLLGGLCNTSNGRGSIIGGGIQNTTSSTYGSILGGTCNTVGSFSSVGGGNTNSSSGTYSVIGGGSLNSILTNFSVIGGGFNNNNAGNYSFIAGGCCNIINGSVSNSFILGSNITAPNSNHTYVNNLLADGNICANNLNILDTIIADNANFTTNLSAFSASFYSTNTFDTVIERDSLIRGDLTVLGSIFTSALSGGVARKYTTLLGDNILSSFTITHNLSTVDIVTTVIDSNTKEVVYPSIIIPNSTQISVNFSFIPTLTGYKVSIIGV